MAVNGWKVTAIIFIILFAIETLYFIWAFNLGTTMIENKAICSNEVCYNVDATAFTYEDYDGLCTCYNGEEVILTKYLT